MPTNRVHQSSPTAPTETVSGMAISLAFWLCLLLAAVLFAIVSLSPRFAIYLELRRQFDTNQVRLVANEDQADRLQRVIDAIRTDKDFAAELTRVEFDAFRPDEEVIPVDSELKLDVRSVDKPLPSIAPNHLWYEPVVRYLASERKLRTGLLVTIALLVIVSFTVLQHSEAEQVATNRRGRTTAWQSLRNRYTSRSA